MLYDRMMSTPTKRLSEFIATIDIDTVPSNVTAVVPQHCLEVIAGTYAGADIPEAITVANLYSDDVADLAGKFAMVSHAAESDPIHAGTTICAGLIAVPPALLMSPDGKTAVAAVLAGYETSIRIGEALGSARLLGQGWWPTAVLGSAGAAASAARAMSLDAKKTRNALSLALILSGGLGNGAPEAPESRNLLAAQCVRSGVLAAQAAAKGIIGPPEPLTGDRGFLTAFGIEPSPEKVTIGLGHDWNILKTSVKAFPCALQAQSALDALHTAISDNGLSVETIRQIEFSLPEAMRRIVDRPGVPASRFGAAASLQFLSAAMLCDGDVLPARMEDNARNDENLVSVMANISIRHEPALDALFPASWPASVRIVTETAEFRAEVPNPPGHPERPIDMTTTIERFRSYGAGKLNASEQGVILEAVSDITNLNELTEIMDPIRALL
jgi:2-methylcitrate dehydratase PrpD